MTETIKPFNPPVYPHLEVELTLVGWSYRDLGNYLNISDDAISKKMRGITEFKLDEVCVISTLFNKSIEYLFMKNNVNG